MNTFQFDECEHENPTLQIRHILNWKKNGKMQEPLMIYKTPLGRIGLLYTNTGEAYKKEFNKVEEVEKYFKRKVVDENTIYVRTTWSVYTG